MSLLPIVKYAAYVSLPFCIMFLVCSTMRRSWLVKGTLRWHTATAFARISVFPGWPAMLLAILEEMLTPVTNGGDYAWNLINIAIQAAAFLAYSSSALRFLNDDDWWKNQGRRLKAYFMTPLSSFREETT